MYATQDDLIRKFGLEELEARAWDDDLDALNTARINGALSDASERIDVYIATAVKLPLDTVPALLVSLAADIARYFLQDDNPLDEARTRYEAAIALLKDIAAGKATLPTPGVTDTGGAVYAHRGDSDRMFTNETLYDYL